MRGRPHGQRVTWEPEHAEDAIEVRLDRLGADTELARDLSVLETAGGEPSDVPLRRRQPARPHRQSPGRVDVGAAA